MLGATVEHSEEKRDVKLT